MCAFEIRTFATSLAQHSLVELVPARDQREVFTRRCTNAVEHLLFFQSLKFELQFPLALFNVGQPYCWLGSKFAAICTAGFDSFCDVPIVCTG